MFSPHTIKEKPRNIVKISDITGFQLAGVEGFEPTEWWSQSPLFIPSETPCLSVL